MAPQAFILPVLSKESCLRRGKLGALAESEAQRRQ